MLDALVCEAEVNRQNYGDCPTRFLRRQQYHAALLDRASAVGKTIASNAPTAPGGRKIGFESHFKAAQRIEGEIAREEMTIDACLKAPGRRGRIAIGPAPPRLPPGEPIVAVTARCRRIQQPSANPQATAAS